MVERRCNFSSEQWRTWAKSLSSRIQSESSSGCDTSFSSRNESSACNREEESKERGHYEIVEKHVFNFSQASLHKISEMKKLICRESDEARSHQATGGNTTNVSTERVSRCLFSSVYLSINHLYFHSNLRITVHLMLLQHHQHEPL